jgi:hypothetical protein
VTDRQTTPKRTFLLTIVIMKEGRAKKEEKEEEKETQKGEKKTRKKE